jgi:hypothetical protein
MEDTVTLFTVRHRTKFGTWQPLVSNLTQGEADDLAQRKIEAGVPALVVAQEGVVATVRDARRPPADKKAQARSAAIREVMKSDGGRY